MLAADIPIRPPLPVRFDLLNLLPVNRPRPSGTLTARYLLGPWVRWYQRLHVFASQIQSVYSISARSCKVCADRQVLGQAASYLSCSDSSRPSDGFFETDASVSFEVEYFQIRDRGPTVSAENPSTNTQGRMRTLLHSVRITQPLSPHQGWHLLTLVLKQSSVATTSKHSARSHGPQSKSFLTPKLGVVEPAPQYTLYIPPPLLSITMAFASLASLCGLVPREGPEFATSRHRLIVRHWKRQRVCSSLAVSRACHPGSGRRTWPPFCFGTLP